MSTATGWTPPGLSRHTREDGVVVMAIVGDLDTAGTAELEPAFQAALPDRTVRAVIDLSGVPFLTSAALAMFVVRAQAMQKAGGKLYLAAPTRIVRDVFERAGFTQMFPILPTVDDAVAFAATEGKAANIVSKPKTGSGPLISS
jgi:anti-sigma B factor antagonist